MNDKTTRLTLLKNALRRPAAGLAAVEVDSAHSASELIESLSDVLINTPVAKIPFNVSRGTVEILSQSKQAVKQWQPPSSGILFLVDTKELDEDQAYHFWSEMNHSREVWSALGCFVVFFLLPGNYQMLLKAADHLSDWIQLKLRLRSIRSPSPREALKQINRVALEVDEAWRNKTQNELRTTLQKQSDFRVLFTSRVDATSDMFQDIEQAKTSLCMYSRVYISNLLKDSERFIGALTVAATKPVSKQSEEFLVRHVSTDHRDLKLSEGVWQFEDPKRETWLTLAEYQTHLAKGDRYFIRNHKLLQNSLNEIPIENRKRVRFQRAYLNHFIVPYSLMVIDDAIVYVSFYSAGYQARHGNFAPTLKLVYNNENDTMAQAFLTQIKQIDRKYSKPGKNLALI